MAVLERVIATEPYNPQGFYRRATILRILGRAKEAEGDLARANELNHALAEMSTLNDQADRNTADPDVRYRIGELCTRLGKEELAASWYRSALACDPGHTGALVRPQVASARIHRHVPREKPVRRQSVSSILKLLPLASTVCLSGVVVVLVYFSGITALGSL